MAPEVVAESEQGTTDSESVDGAAEEASPALDVALKTGLLVGAFSLYELFVGPNRSFGLSDQSGDLLALRATGNTAFVHVGVAAFAVAVLTAFLFVGFTRHDTSRIPADVAWGVSVAPGLIYALVFLIIFLEIPLNALLAGDFLLAVGYIVALPIGLVVLYFVGIGWLFVLVVFGLFLGFPAYVGSYLGTLVGRLVRTDASH